MTKTRAALGAAAATSRTAGGAPVAATAPVAAASTTRGTASAVASVASEMLRRPLAVLQRRSLCAAAAEAERLKAIKASLTLPSTAFPLHAKHAANEPALAAKLAVDHYASQTKLRAAKSTRDFILHDGPPYANGELHMGHFLMP